MAGSRTSGTMRARLLFLAKFLGCSLLLDAAWPAVSSAYVAALGGALDWLTGVPGFFSPGDAPGIAELSRLLIPLFSLVLVTPGVRPARRAALLAAGAVAFGADDLAGYWSFAQLVRTHRLALGSPLFLAASAVPLTVKWLLPFLLGALPNYARLKAVFAPPPAPATVPE